MNNLRIKELIPDLQLLKTASQLLEMYEANHPKKSLKINRFPLVASYHPNDDIFNVVNNLYRYRGSLTKLKKLLETIGLTDVTVSRDDNLVLEVHYKIGLTMTFSSANYLISKIIADFVIFSQLNLTCDKILDSINVYYNDSGEVYYHTYYISDLLTEE